MVDPRAAPAVSDELVRLGWDEHVGTCWAEAADGDLTPGRVIRTSRHFTYVGTDRGLVRAVAPPGLEPAPVTGDWVGLAAEGPDDDATVALVLERHSALARRDPAGGHAVQVLAANVDVVLIVAGLDRPLPPGRLERSLVLAWESGAEPVVVLTKADTLGERERKARTEAVAALAPGVRVLCTSTRTGDGFDELAGHLARTTTVVMLGESGAGKSSIVNRLAGNEVQRTAEVRGADAKGRHTTVTRDLIVLDGGGIVIDTPGLRSLGLLEADEGLAATFADVEALAGDCRFRDCHHAREPGCAVRSAVERGEIDADRAERYRVMRAEADEHRDRRRTERVASKAMRRVQRDKYPNRDDH